MITQQTILEIAHNKAIYINQNTIINNIIEYGLSKNGYFNNTDEIILFSKPSINFPEIINFQEIPSYIYSNPLIKGIDLKVNSEPLDHIDIEKGVDVIGNIIGLSYLITGKNTGYDTNNRILLLTPEGVLAGIFAVNYFEQELIDNCKNIIIPLLDKNYTIPTSNVSVSELAAAYFLLFILTKGIDYAWTNLFPNTSKLRSLPFNSIMSIIYEIQLKYIQKFSKKMN